MLTTHLRWIESDVAKTYTIKIFKKVKQEIMKVGALIVKEQLSEGVTTIFTLKKYCEADFEREVVYDALGKTLRCSCRLFDSR